MNLYKIQMSDHLLRMCIILRKKNHRQASNLNPSIFRFALSEKPLPCRKYML